MYKIPSGSYYVVGNLAVGLVPMFLIPVLTRYLSTESYGVLAIYQTMITVFVITSGSFVVNTVNRIYFSQDEGRSSSYQGYVAAALLVVFICTGFSLLLLLVIHGLGGLDATLATLFLGAILHGSFTSVIQIRLGQWQIKKEPKKYVITQVMLAVLSGALTAIAVVHVISNEWGRIFPQLISLFIVALAAVFSLVHTKDYQVISLVYKNVKDLVGRGVYLIPHMLVSGFLTTADKAVVGLTLGLREAGIYFVTFQLARVIDIFTTGVNKALIAYVFEKLEENKKGAFDEVFFQSSALSTLFMVCGIASWYLIIAFENFLVGGEFYVDKVVLLLCIQGFVFKGCYLVFSNFLFYFEKNKLLSTLSLKTLILSSVCLFVGSYYFGIQGAAAGFMFGMFWRFYSVFRIVVKLKKNQEV
ncbi:lipopolysaccharide biosynthesis protein [Luminiphilus sp.]|nr:lipopolysaccharide biosynthesis protein [Luminiphilus sp.]